MINYDHRGNRTPEQEKEQDSKFEKSLKTMKQEFIDLGGYVEIRYSETEPPKLTASLNNGDIGGFLYRLHSL